MLTRSHNNIHKPNTKFNYVAHKSVPNVPTTYHQAQKISHWRKAMEDEFDALIKNKTWDLVPPNPTKNVVDCRWLFRIKHKPDGTVDRYKARLVIKGFTQRPGVDFHDTFSPVVKPVTVRLILSLAVQQKWPIHQLDVNNAFLQGTLEDEVSMSQPKGFEHPDYPNYICKLNKAIYGLRQAPRVWYKEFLNFLITIGFTKSKSDESLFILHAAEVTVYILVYVDDIIITGSTSSIVRQIIDKLSVRFSLKDLGVLN